VVFVYLLDIFYVSVIGHEAAHTSVCVSQVAREGKEQVRQAILEGTKVAMNTFGGLLHVYNFHDRIILWLRRRCEKVVVQRI
jgi:hypothetical protein